MFHHCLDLFYNTKRMIILLLNIHHQLIYVIGGCIIYKHLMCFIIY